MCRVPLESIGQIVGIHDSANRQQLLDLEIGDRNNRTMSSVTDFLVTNLEVRDLSPSLWSQQSIGFRQNHRHRLLTHKPIISSLEQTVIEFLLPNLMRMADDLVMPVADIDSEHQTPDHETSQRHLENLHVLLFSFRPDTSNIARYRAPQMLSKRFALALPTENEDPAPILSDELLHGDRQNRHPNSCKTNRGSPIPRRAPFPSRSEVRRFPLPLQSAPFAPECAWLPESLAEHLDARPNDCRCQNS